MVYDFSLVNRNYLMCVVIDVDSLDAMAETPPVVDVHGASAQPTEVLVPSAPSITSLPASEFPRPSSSTIPFHDVNGTGLTQFDEFDFGLPPFDTYLGDPYGLDFDANLLTLNPSADSVQGVPGVSQFPFDFDLSAFTPLQEPPPPTFYAQNAAGFDFPSNFDWSAFIPTPESELPPLPPPPASPPVNFAEPEEPTAGGSVQTKRSRQEVDEKNIIHSKRQRTMSSRAADAAAVERPAKKVKRSR